MKYKPSQIGFFQALGLGAYVALFANIVNQLGNITKDLNFSPNPVFSIITFLLTFITSALICGAITFGYPISLFLNGKKSQALKTISWTAGWLVVIFIIFLIIALKVLSNI
jgi:hypothetical protein